MPRKIFSEISDAFKGIDHPLETAISATGETIPVFSTTEEGLIEDINRLTHVGGVKATIYTSYGYRQNDQWVIPLRGRVHQLRKLPEKFIARIVANQLEFEGDDLSILIERSRDFTDDSRSRQKVSIRFDTDQEEQFDFPTSDFNGLIQLEIKLSDEKARQLLKAQGSTEWLTFSVVSDGHQGQGRVRLIAPEGLSVVSDIDDTIKVTLVPGDKDEVLRRTLCRTFEHVPEMAERYNRDWSAAAFHYVTGGPWQLYRALDAFLIKGAGGFPDGSFHMTYHPKNFLSEDTREILIESIAGSLGRTFTHKIDEITKLMLRFPGRKFILVGDSGEVDPEVYRHIREQFGAQVQEIWIRDVLNEAKVNSYRLDGMNVIKVEPTVCATIHHYKKLSMRFHELYDVPYVKNTAPPCG